MAGGIWSPPALDPKSVSWLPFTIVLLVPFCAVVVTVAQLAILLPALRAGTLAMRFRWTPGRVALRRVLVIAQGAAATGLAFAAIASVQGLVAIERRDLGFDAAKTLSARVMLTPLPSDRPLRWERFYTSLLNELKRLPGVETVGILQEQPGESTLPSVWTAADMPSFTGPLIARRQAVHPSFFKEMGMSAIAGRLCDAIAPEDRSNSAVVNEAMAERYWPNRNPIGVHLSPGHYGPLTIVGVVPSLRRSILEAAPTPEVFECAPLPRMYVIIRHTGEWQGLAHALAPLAHRIDTEATVDDIAPIDELVDRSLRPTKVLAGFLVSLGTVAVIIAALGMFAIAAMIVSQRRTELAIRIAVGADPVALGRRLEAESLGLGAIGILGGCLLYRTLVQYFASQAVELLLPWSTAAESTSALLLLMWLAVKWPAHSLRSITLATQLRQD